MDVEFDGLELERARGLPRGTLRRLREDLHGERCALKYFEYLRERAHF